MLQQFSLRDGKVVSTVLEPAPILIYTAPTEEEKRHLLTLLGTDLHSLNSALDPEELSRVEVEPDHLLIIWKCPVAYAEKARYKFGVSSHGFFLSRDTLVVVQPEDNTCFECKEFQNLETVRHALLAALLHTIHQFVGHLRMMRQVSNDIQAKLEESLGNEHLLHMFYLSESVIYYENSITTNQAVLEKLQRLSTKLEFSLEENEMLEDILIENAQCERQAEIYSQVLSGLMDARGNIINNNMNLLLKNLSIINIIFLPLTLLASIGGMSEYSMITSTIPWPISYGALILGMAAVGVAMWWLLDRRSSKVRRK